MQLITMISILLWTGPAFSQNASDKRRIHHPPVVNTEIEQQSYMVIDASENWAAWISSNYPDNSGSWPTGCAESLDAGTKSSTWDFMAKGDFNKLGAPTALMLRFDKIAGSDTRKMIGKFSIIECRDGRWLKLLGLDAKEGVSSNGKNLRRLRLTKQRGYSVTLATGVQALPGLHISANPLNEKGRGLAQGIDFAYDPDARKYNITAR